MVLVGRYVKKRRYEQGSVGAIRLPASSLIYGSSENLSGENFSFSLFYLLASKRIGYRISAQSPSLEWN